jgi:catechol 2,3-dioxygenase-like lactoylglutathione lyase family enzyme
MITSVMTNLYASDVERSVAFYRDLLGGTPTFRYPPEGPASHVELRLGETVIAISHRDAVAPQGLPEPMAGNPMELVLWCDDADAIVATLRAAGAPVLVEPSIHDASGHRRAYVADPDGHWIALVSRQ